MLDKMAYCGLVCSTCPIYLATREEDEEEQARMRSEIARVCSSLYDKAYAPGDITDCDGCTVKGGRLFSSCRACPIRTCARRRGLASCAFCPGYPCEELEGFLITEPEAQIRLEELRRSIEARGETVYPLKS